MLRHLVPGPALLAARLIGEESQGLLPASPAGCWMMTFTRL